MPKLPKGSREKAKPAASGGGDDRVRAQDTATPKQRKGEGRNGGKRRRNRANGGGAQREQANGAAKARSAKADADDALTPRSEPTAVAVADPNLHRRRVDDAAAPGGVAPPRALEL